MMRLADCDYTRLGSGEPVNRLRLAGGSPTWAQATATLRWPAVPPHEVGEQVGLLDGVVEGVVRVRPAGEQARAACGRFTAPPNGTPALAAYERLQVQAAGVPERAPPVNLIRYQ